MKNGGFQIMAELKGLSQSLLENVTNDFFSMLGNTTTSVKIEISSNQEMEACTNGIKLFNRPSGKIRISNGLIKNLSHDELRFVIAHEVYHIDQNHVLQTAISNLPKILIDYYAKTNDDAKCISGVLDAINGLIYLKGDLPPLVKMAKEQEINADIWSILATRNKTDAIRCLHKLVNDDVKQWSHKWEIFKALGLNVELPVMTMEQRIENIKAGLSKFETLGYKLK